MRLLTEFLEGTTSIIVEGTDTKQLFIEGIFAQAEVDNRNGRRYKLPVLEREVDSYNQQFVRTNRALGELNHPESPIVNPERASHRVVSLMREGNNFVGKALVLNTPMGNIVKGLIEGGTSLGVSTRGLGTVKSIGGINEVQDDFELKCIDIVANPSAPDSFVNGIMEGVEFFYADGVLHRKSIEAIKEEIHKTPKQRLTEKKIAIFKRVMDSINNP